MSTEAVPYYVKLGKGVDELVRCHACRQLVTTAFLSKLGRCRCGAGKFDEIRTLSEEEMADIQSGKIDFPNRAEFLAEFAPLDEDGA
jgi:hypothetical protein